MLKDFSLTPITSLLLSLASILVGVGLALAYMWPIALISLGCIPIMVFATKIEMEMTLGLDTAKDEGDEKGALQAGNVLSESLTNIRVVYALEIQEKVSDNESRRMNASISHEERSDELEKA